MTETPLEMFLGGRSADVEQRVTDADEAAVFNELVARVRGRLGPTVEGQPPLSLRLGVDAPSRLTADVTITDRGTALEVVEEPDVSWAWASLGDAVLAELGLRTAETAFLIGRLSISASADALSRLSELERAQPGSASLLRSLLLDQPFDVARASEVARDIDLERLVREQLQVVGEAICALGLIPESLRWSLQLGVRTASGHVSATLRSDDGALSIADEPATGSEQLRVEFLDAVDYLRWCGGAIELADVLMRGRLEVDGDATLLTLLSQVPEPIAVRARLSIAGTTASAR